MNFNKHSELEGRHAFLSPSSYYWVNYDAEKLEKSYLSSQAVARGTELHDLAAKCIKLGVNLPKSRKTLNMYVNDSIGYRMTPEQILCYSPNCFGTADAIACRNGFLRIHDLKTGVTPANMHQLEIYAAIFFLEYHLNPEDFKMELRIYQSNEVSVLNPEPELIKERMDKIVAFDRQIQLLKEV